MVRPIISLDSNLDKKKSKPFGGSTLLRFDELN